MGSICLTESLKRTIYDGFDKIYKTLIFLLLVLSLGDFCLVGTLLAGEKKGATILLPPPPVRIPPPESPTKKASEQMDEALKEKREVRKQREEALEPPPKDPTTKRNEKLLEETNKPRNLKMFIDCTLVYPRVLTKGNRKNYQVEPTAHTHFYLRMLPDKPINEWQLWYGGRLASFTGSGIYEGVPGRFGFLYAGPLIAIGSVDLFVKSDPNKPKRANVAVGEEADDDVTFPSRDGWFFASGIAAQNRIGVPANPEREVSDDLNTKSVAFDSPGLWFEATYVRIYFGAVSFNISIGAQAGRGKTFLWGGLGAAGWY